MTASSQCRNSSTRDTLNKFQTTNFTLLWSGTFPFSSVSPEEKESTIIRHQSQRQSNAWSRSKQQPIRSLIAIPRTSNCRHLRHWEHVPLFFSCFYVKPALLSALLLVGQQWSDKTSRWIQNASTSFRKPLLSRSCNILSAVRSRKIRKSRCCSNVFQQEKYF